MAGALITTPIAMLAQMLGYGVGLSLLDGRQRRVTAILGGVGRAGHFALATMLVCLGGVVGTIILIVPGIVWSVATGFAPLLVVAEDGGAWHALRRSVHLTRGVRAKLVAVLLGSSIGSGLAIGQIARMLGLGASPDLVLLLEPLQPFLLLLQIACYLELAREPVAAPAAGRRTIDPTLVVAGSWSATLAGLFLVVVGRQLLRPIPSALMMPPVHGVNVDTSAPLSEWCAYSLHARARECETALGDTHENHVFGANGFGYQGARCVPLAEHRQPLPRTAALAQATDALERAVGDRAVVRRDQRIGGQQLDVAVLADDAAQTVLLALDVALDSRDAEARAAALAAAAVPEYWRVELHPDRDPLTNDMLYTWKRPDAASARYTSMTRSSQNPDARLRISSLPDVLVPVDDLLPFPCRTPTTRRTGH